MTIAPALGGTYETMYTMGVAVGLVPYNFDGLSFIPVMYSFPSPAAYNFTYITGIIFLLVALFLTTIIKKGDKNEL